MVGALTISGHIQQDTEVLKLKQAYKELQDKLDSKINRLDQRVRELSCLYSIADLGEQPGVSHQEVLQKAIDYIISTLHYPDMACGRAFYEGQEFQTKNFQQTQWKHSCEIIVYGRRVGVVEIFYFEKMGHGGGEPFIHYEKNLLSAITRQLSRVFERKETEAALKEREEQHRRLIELSPEATIIHRRGKIIFVNNASV